MNYSFLFILSICHPAYQQQAIIPLLWVIVAAIDVITLTWATCAIFSGDPKPIKGKSLAVLGMQGAGKTHFLANIRNIPYENTSTISGEKFKQFNLIIGNRQVVVNEGIDIPGGEEAIREYYVKLIKENEIVFFLFDSFKYINEREYRENTQNRLDFIYRHSSDSNNCSVILFGTFLDHFSSDDERNNARASIKNSVSGKVYSQMFMDNRFFMLDMRNKDVLKNNILNKIFV